MVNKVILLGNVGGDPEIKHFDDGSENGSAVARFSLATSESYMNKSGERIVQEEWHRIVAWRNFAKYSEYIHKGSLVYVEGRIRTNSWTDKDNVQKYSTEIQADKIQILSKKDSSKPNETSINTTNTSKTKEESEIEDLPF